MARERSAPGLLAGVGLLADGPVVWGRPVPAHGPGVYVVELPDPLPRAPIDVSLVGLWIERVETLRLDGARPTSKALATRLASFWLPDEVVLYIGMTTSVIGGRVGAYYHTPLGDRRPHAGGHWLKTFHELGGLRVWWAETDAPEEYEDALFSAFAEGVGADARAALPDASVVLPFANLLSATGERRPHGVTGAVLADTRPVEPAAPPRRRIDVPPGDAEGATRELKGGGSIRPPRPPVTRRAPTRPVRPPAPSPAQAASASRVEVVDVTAGALEHMKAERKELMGSRRPEVVARIKAARELGDLKENAEYHAAREEQSFLEGRIQLLDDRIRNARVIEAGRTPGVGLGSTVTVEHDGETMTFTVVGSTEADPAQGRISSVSPVGAALLGRSPGDVVDVRTPRGSARYKVLALG